jgi:hypothetical protein
VSSKGINLIPFNAAVRGASLSDPLDGVVYARHGRELMGCKSPVREPMLPQVLANGKGGRATDRLKEA